MRISEIQSRIQSIIYIEAKNKTNNGLTKTLYIFQIQTFLPKYKVSDLATGRYFFNCLNPQIYLR